MTKVITKHFDMLSKEIIPGAFVACQLNNYRTLELCVVSKINPKMIKLRSINTNKWGRYYEANKYPNEMIVIDNQEDITMYILKNSDKK